MAVDTPPVHVAHWRPCKSFARFSDSLGTVSHPRTCYNLHWTVKPRVVRQKPSNCYRSQMLVTWYDDIGKMYDGRYTYPGAAAGGYELPIGTTVIVPGVGRLSIHDRIGFQPWSHIDVWVNGPATARALGLSKDYRVVTVCR